MRTATNGSDVCYSVFFKTVRWAVKSQNIKIYICKGPSSSSHVLVFVCRSSALKGRGESQVFHPHAAWFHLLLWDARQRDLWSVLQGQRVCAARLRVCMEPPDGAPDYWNCAFPPWPGRTKRCRLFVQTTEEGTFLHVCSFPAVDVLLYVEMQLEVVERSNDTHLYSRTVCVEDHREKCSSQIQHAQYILHFTFSM